jgi:hypothetical protein
MDEDIPVNEKTLQAFVDGKLKGKDDVEIFVMVDQCTSWHDAYMKLLAEKNA